MPLRRRYCTYCTLDGDGWAGCRVESRDEPVHLLYGEEEVRHLGRCQLAEPRHAAQRRHKHVTCGDKSTWLAATQARDLRRHKHVTCGDTSTLPAATQARDLRRQRIWIRHQQSDMKIVQRPERSDAELVPYGTHTIKNSPEKRTVRKCCGFKVNLHPPDALFS